MVGDTATRDYWLQDLHTLESIERWGAALFLAGIALVARQIAVLAGAGPFVPPGWCDFIPLAIGAYGTVFLRVVHGRIHEDKEKLGGARLKPGNGKRKFGCLGWMFAIMPVAFGLVMTAALCS